MSRQLAITKQYSLAELGDGWKDCYLTYRPLTAKDLLDIQSMEPEKMDAATSTQYMLTFIKHHVTGGQVKIEGDGVVDFTEDDIDSLPTELIASLFAQLTGTGMDPKDMPPAQPAKSEPSSEPNS